MLGVVDHVGYQRSQTRLYRNCKERHHAGLPKTKFGTKYLKICATKNAQYHACPTTLKQIQEKINCFTICTRQIHTHSRLQPIAFDFEKSRLFEPLARLFEPEEIIFQFSAENKKSYSIPREYWYGYRFQGNTGIYIDSKGILVYIYI